MLLVWQEGAAMKDKPRIMRCICCGEAFTSDQFAQHLKIPAMRDSPSRTKIDCLDTYSLRERGWWQNKTGVWEKGST